MRTLTPALLCIALLAAWLGASAIVGAVVAPAAFNVLPTRTLAGALVGRVLPVLFWAGAVIGLLALALAWQLPHREPRIAAGVVLVASAIVAQLVITPRIDQIRRSITGPMDALDPSNPARQAFGHLHAASVACLGLGGVAALVMLVLLVRLASRSTS